MRSRVALEATLREANFESLQQTFFYETGAAGAARLVRPYGSARRLDSLLRDHRLEEVSNLAEIHMRDLFDALLSFYSLVEIGAEIGAVPEPLPRAFQTAALKVLQNPACRAYYVERYPLPLPQALLQRLDPGLNRNGSTGLRESGPMEIAVPRFQELVAFELRFRSDDEIAVMLRLLDGFTVGGEKLATLVAFAKDVENYQTAVSSRGNEGGVRARALRGFGKLLAAMVRLDALLAECEPCPLLQSAIWHYYQYWIQRASAETSLVSIIASWHDRPAIDDADVEDERQALVEYIGQVRAAFGRLASSQYRRIPILSPHSK